MHGRVKVRTTAEQEAKKKKERAEKLEKYKAGISVVFAKRKEGTYDDELFMVIERILLQNPDIYTLWNIRREGYIHNDWNETVREDFLKREMTLTENCLRENPKSYCVWHQRTWIMKKTKVPDWQHELGLCAKCLNLDERNFHCWDYREFVVQSAGISAEEEFGFSTSKILNNFSNYSSWHYRSRLLSQMFERWDECMINERKKEELDLVMNATFTDPSDSSAWFYQRWLLDSDETSPALQRASLQRDFAVLAFDRDILATFELFVDQKKVFVDWQAPSATKFSRIWSSSLEEQVENLEEAADVRIKIQDDVYLLRRTDASRSSVTWTYKSRRKKHTANYDHEQLNEQLLNYKQLAEMEPENKWTLLTGVLLMRKIDPVRFKDDILQSLDALRIIDSLRINYYNDLRCKYVVEECLRKQWENEAEDELSKVLDLSDLSLTCLSEDQHFAFFEEVNLGANSLQNSLYRLSGLRSCEKLSLSSNRLHSLERFPILPRLRCLSLRNNLLEDVGEVLTLVERHRRLERLDIRENPVCTSKRLAQLVSENRPDLVLCFD